VLIIVLSVAIFFLLAVYSLFAQPQALWTFEVTNKVRMDVYGGFLPVMIGIILVILYLGHFRFSRMKLLASFIVSTSLTFIFFSSSERGMRGYPVLFVLVVGSAVWAFSFCKNPLETIKKKYLAAMLTATGCFPLSTLVFDLFWLPQYTSPFYVFTTIGGGGLVDGILLSTVLVPLWITFLTATCVLSAEWNKC
jgi:hypothetical protein